MTKINHRALRAKALRAIDDLRWVADHASEIANRANADVDDALRGRRYDGDGRGGAVLTAPEAHVDRRLSLTESGDVRVRADSTHEQITRFLGTITLATDSASVARDLAGELTTSTDLNDRREQSATARATGGRGDCENCGHFCSGSRNDRLVTPTTSDVNRAGAIAQCDPCLRYWRRHLELRPPRLWGDDTAA